MRQRRGYWRSGDAEAAIVAWRASGLSLQAFARQRGWSRQRLAYWVRRVGDAPSGSGFVELRPANEPIDVIAASGVLVRVRSGFDPALLRAVLAALA